MYFSFLLFFFFFLLQIKVKVSFRVMTRQAHSVGNTALGELNPKGISDWFFFFSLIFVIIIIIFATPIIIISLISVITVIILLLLLSLFAIIYNYCYYCCIFVYFHFLLFVNFLSFTSCIFGIFYHSLFAFLHFFHIYYRFPLFSFCFSPFLHFTFSFRLILHHSVKMITFLYFTSLQIFHRIFSIFFHSLLPSFVFLFPLRLPTLFLLYIHRFFFSGSFFFLFILYLGLVSHSWTYDNMHSLIFDYKSKPLHIINSSSFNYTFLLSSWVIFTVYYHLYLFLIIT